MKSKKLIILIFCLITILAIFYYNSSDRDKFTKLNKDTTFLNHDTKPKVTINTPKDGSINVFEAILGPDVEETGMVTEPGHRFFVEIVENGEENLSGIVIINDPVNKINPILFNSNGEKVITKYRFHTKYDAKNNWYTIIETEYLHSSLTGGGDQ